MNHTRVDTSGDNSPFPYSWALTDKSFIRHSQCQVPSSGTVATEVSRWNPDITNLTNLDRQNFVLHWIQTALGITLQQFLSANTSSARNKRAVIHDENLIINRAAPGGDDGISLSRTIKDPVAMSVSASTYLRGLATPSSATRRLRAPTLNEQFWDQWYNGTLLSEIVAALIIDKKSLVKEVEFFDNYGRLVVPRKLLLVGTVHVVKSTAQMLNNMEICLKVVSEHLPMVPPLKFFAQDIVYGPPDILWSILYTLYKAYGSTGRKNTPSSSSGGGGRGCVSRGTQRGTSPSRSDLSIRGRTLHSSTSSGQSGAPRSSSAPPASSGHRSSHDQLKLHKNVHFSSSTKGTTLNGATGQSKVSAPAVNAAGSVRSSTGRGAPSDLMASFAALPKRRSRSLSPVSIGRVSANTSRSSGSGGGSVASAPSHYEQMQLLVEARNNEKMRDRLRARAIDRKHRKKAIDELEGCHSSPVTEPVSPMMHDQFNAADRTTSQSSGNLNTLEKGGKRSVRQGWYPPPMSPTELERVRLITPPTVTTQQQGQIKSWLASLQIYLLEGEGGYYSRVNHTTAEIPPPLPLADDRLRNGVLLCGLAVLLERHAAGHVNLAALTHMRPTTLRMAVENLDRALWLFKMRRSPPIPVVFLSQPEEIIKCHKNLLWGLLYELMQAYPQGDTRPDDFRSNMGTGNVHPRSFDPSARESLAREEEEQEQRDQVLWPQTAGRVKYNSKRRREVDVMLMAWLTSSGVLRMLYGKEYSPPVSVMALEAFVKDGSLLRQIITHVLDIKVQGHIKATTFELCLSNTKKCIETLRRLGGRMNDRYLYAGVEEQLLRGDWDCILGLLEDIKLYADSIVKTPSVSAFQSQKALEMRFEHHQQQHQHQQNAKSREVRLDAPGAVLDYTPEDFLLSNLCEFDDGEGPATASTVEGNKVRLSCEGVASRDTTPYMWGMGTEDERGRYFDLIPSRHIPNPFDETLRQQQPTTGSVPDGDGSVPADISLSGPPPTAAPSVAQEDEVEFPARAAPVPQPAPRLPSPGRLKKTSAATAALADSDRDDEEGEEEDDSLDHPSLSRKNKRILLWVKKLGVEITPEVDFSDGRVLHTILIKLVRCNPLPGFIASPRTNAHKIQNIRRCLEYLAANQKRIPLFALSCEEDILHNNFEAICDLLRAIRRGYSIHQA